MSLLIRVFLISITVFLVACQSTRVEILVFNSTDHSYLIKNTGKKHELAPRQRLRLSLKQNGVFEVGLPGRAAEHSYSVEKTKTLKSSESLLLFYCGDRRGLYLVDETKLYFYPASQVPNELPEFQVLAKMEDVDFVPLPDSCILEDGQAVYSVPQVSQYSYRLVRVSPELSKSEARAALKEKLESWWLESIELENSPVK